VAIGFKSNVPLGRDSHPHWEQNLTVGSMAVQSVTGLGFGTFTYGHYNFILPKTHTRFTGGGFVGNRNLFLRNTGNVVAAVEQELFHGKAVVMMEWFRGRHDFGFAIPGVMIRKQQHMFVLGYKIPNSLANGRHGFVVEYGITWGKRKGTAVSAEH
jgi:hypothetical protein